MTDPIPSWARSILSAVAAVTVFGPLVIILFGLGGRSVRTPTPLAIVGYDGPQWVALVGAVCVLAGGLTLTLLLRRTES